jgi:hypothetical protein
MPAPSADLDDAAQVEKLFDGHPDLPQRATARERDE